MPVIAEQVDTFAATLLARAPRYNVDLLPSHRERLIDYYKLLQQWNPRLHLVAPCPPEEFAWRHVLESLLLLPQLKPKARVGDIGSGGGLPIIPNLISRPDIKATLIESSSKKCVFLREALRTTGTATQATVVAERFETTTAPDVDYISCRALDQFKELLPKMVDWSPARSTLLLFGGEDLERQLEQQRRQYSRIQLPDSERRYLYVVRPME